ncbi:MAG TPA: VOC family protein [Acidimicrobiia bacterium]|nr:VOC family protein [Acidimicrobiia bacterium]
MDERPRLWVGHVVLATHDLPRAHEFYSSLGLRALRDPGPEDVIVELEMRGGTHLVLVFDPQARIHNRVAPFDLMCDDPDALHDELSARGIEVTPVRRDHHGDFTFRDPDGYIVTVNESHVEGPV